MSLFSATVTTSCPVLHTTIDAAGLDKYTAHGIFSLRSPLMDLLLIGIDLPTVIINHDIVVYSVGLLSFCQYD